MLQFDLEKQTPFNQGQMHVALSRVTDINNLHFIGKQKSDAVQVNQNETTENNGLLEQIKFDHGSSVDVESHSLTGIIAQHKIFKKAC